jgi:hypothetical protein
VRTQQQLDVVRFYSSTLRTFNEEQVDVAVVVGGGRGDRRPVDFSQAAVMLYRRLPKKTKSRIKMMRNSHYLKKLGIFEFRILYWENPLELSLHLCYGQSPWHPTTIRPDSSAREPYKFVTFA